MQTKQVTILVFCFSVSILLSSLIYLSYTIIHPKDGGIAIPAGSTYLGPNDVLPDWAKPAGSVNTPTPAISQTIYSAGINDTWNTWSGTLYAYTFSYPESLPLFAIKADPMDAVGISWGGRKPQEQILISIIDLSKNESFKQYVNKPKKDFVDVWWKQYSGLIGHTDIAEFTNSKGLQGYKTRFINKEGKTPNLDIFFEVPREPNLVIRIANGILDPAVFDKIVDSVSWGKKK